SNFLGSFVAPLVLVPIAVHWNWRVAFFLAGVPGLVLAVLIARYVHEPEKKPEPQADGAGATAAVGYLAMLRYRNMILCVAMSIFMVAWMVLGWVFLPLFYVKVRQLSAGEMSVLMSLLGLSAAFFSFVVPGLSDRLGRRPVVAGCSLLGLLVPLAALTRSEGARAAARCGGRGTVTACDLRACAHHAGHERHGSRGGVRAAARRRPHDHLRQSGLDGAADVPRLSRRLPLRARAAGVRGGRHGRRVRAGARHGGVREPALGHRRRTRRRELVHGVS